MKAELAGQPDRFISRTGDEAKEVGRHANATVWSLTRASESDRADSGSPGCGGERLTSDSPLESQMSSGPHPSSQAKPTQTPESHTARDYQRLQQRVRALNALPEAEAEAEWQLIAERGTLPTDPDLELSRLTAKVPDLDASPTGGTP